MLWVSSIEEKEEEEEEVEKGVLFLYLVLTGNIEHLTAREEQWRDLEKRNSFDVC